MCIYTETNLICLLLSLFWLLEPSISNSSQLALNTENVLTGPVREDRFNSQPDFETIIYKLKRKVFLLSRQSRFMHFCSRSWEQECTCRLLYYGSCSWIWKSKSESSKSVIWILFGENVMTLSMGTKNLIIPDDMRIILFGSESERVRERRSPGKKAKATGKECSRDQDLPVSLQTQAKSVYVVQFQGHPQSWLIIYRVLRDPAIGLRVVEAASFRQGRS